MEKYFGEDTPKLGFGLMRLPKDSHGKPDRRISTRHLFMITENLKLQRKKHLLTAIPVRVSRLPQNYVHGWADAPKNPQNSSFIQVLNVQEQAILTTIFCTHFRQIITKSMINFIYGQINSYYKLIKIYTNQ